MRKIILISVLLATTCLTNAQNSAIKTKDCPEGCNHEQFLDKVFVEGKVINSKNEELKAFLNYSLITNSIVYIEPNGVLYQLNIDKYSKVIYGNRTFIPFGKNKVAEVLKAFDDGIILLLERKTRENDKIDDAYGVSATTSSVQKVSYYVGDSFIYNPRICTDTKKFIFSTTYSLRINDKIESISSKKKIKKLFPDKEEVINAEFKKKVPDETSEQRYIRIISACVE